jgi:single-stranded-DNA-specific exonuclease
MAAGLTIEPAKVEPFRQRFNEVAKSRLKTEDLQPALRLDSEVKLADMDFGAVRQLERLGPVGQGNAPAQFVARKLTHQRPLQRIGPNKQHVKMWVTDGVNNHESVWWGAGNESLPVGQFDLAFVPRIDTYNGRAAVQLKVLDWRTSE